MASTLIVLRHFGGIKMKYLSDDLKKWTFFEIMNEKSTNEILDELSEMSKSVHSALKEITRINDSDTSFQGAREALLASIQGWFHLLTKQ